VAQLEQKPDLAPDGRNNFEPHLVAMLDAKQARQGKGGYKPREAQDVSERLNRLLVAHGVQQQAHNVRRMGGGASKEQFLFDLVGPGGGTDERLVLRMDPLEGIIETCRAREAQVIEAIGGTVPAPSVAFVDADGRHMGQPAMITRFVRGDTKPRDATSGPSGVGIVIGERASVALIPQYLNNLVAPPKQRSGNSISGNGYLRTTRLKPRHCSPTPRAGCASGRPCARHRCCCMVITALATSCSIKIRWR
jgi:hypothetical protein